MKTFRAEPVSLPPPARSGTPVTTQTIPEPVPSAEPPGYTRMYDTGLIRDHNEHERLRRLMFNEPEPLLPHERIEQEYRQNVSAAERNFQRQIDQSRAEWEAQYPMTKVYPRSPAYGGDLRIRATMSDTWWWAWASLWIVVDTIALVLAISARFWR